MADAAVTRRRALGLIVGGLAGVAAVATGCSPGGGDGSSRMGGAALASGSQPRATPHRAVIYAGPTCGCCGGYARYLRSEGYAVDLRRTDRVDAIRVDAGVPDEAVSCHTTMIGDYVIEGHVPREAIDKLLRERPGVDGIALPGMPPGSPGMGGTKEAPFEIVAYQAGNVSRFMTL